VLNAFGAVLNDHPDLHDSKTDRRG
jgi:hypothetical protein